MDKRIRCANQYKMCEYKYLPEWVDGNLDCGCTSCCVAVKEAFNIAMETLHDQKDVTFKVHLNRDVIGSYGYESGFDAKKEYKSAGEAIKRIEGIGDKK